MSGISCHFTFLEYVDLVQILGSIIMWLTRAGLVEGTDESWGNAHTGVDEGRKWETLVSLGFCYRLSVPANYLGFNHHTSCGLWLQALKGYVFDADFVGDSPYK